MFDANRIYPILLLFPLIFITCEPMQTEQEISNKNLMFRRVVTGHTIDGKSIIASDTVIEKQSMWGIELRKIWGAEQPSQPTG